MLNKSLIQFSVDGWGCVPSLLFDLRPNYDGGNEDNGDLLQKGPMHPLLHSVPPPTAGHRRPMPLPETPGHSRVNLDQPLMGSLLLSPGACCEQAFIVSVCPPRVCFSVLCKFWLLYGGVNGDLLQEDLCHTQVCCTQSPCPLQQSPAPRAPAPEAVHCSSTLPQETQFWLSLCGVSGPWCAQGMFEPSKHLQRVWRLTLTTMSPLLPSSLPLDMGCLLTVAPVPSSRCSSATILLVNQEMEPKKKTTTSFEVTGDGNKV